MRFKLESSYLDSSWYEDEEEEVFDVYPELKKYCDKIENRNNDGVHITIVTISSLENLMALCNTKCHSIVIDTDPKWKKEYKVDGAITIYDDYIE